VLSQGIALKLSTASGSCQTVWQLFDVDLCIVVVFIAAKALCVFEF